MSGMEPEGEIIQRDADGLTVRFRLSGKLTAHPRYPVRQKSASAVPVCVHYWREIEVGCEDCGTHPGLRCILPGCPLDDDFGDIDLIYNDDPRDIPQGGDGA